MSNQNMMLERLVELLEEDVKRALTDWRKPMAEIDMPVFAGRMREAREKRGVGKTEAAKMIGVGKSVVRYWENGQRVPNAWSLYQICMAYGVSADWLLGLEAGNER